MPILYERVRFCLSAAHTKPQLLEAMEQLTVVGRELGVLFQAALPCAELQAAEEKDRAYAEWLRTAPLVARKEVEVVKGYCRRA